MRLVVIEHAQYPPGLLGERSGHGLSIDRAIDDKQGAAGGLHPLVAVGHDEPRHLHVGRRILDKDGMARFVMGDDGLRARHDAAPHRDLALVHRHPRPIGDHVPIDRGALARLGR